MAKVVLEDIEQVDLAGLPEGTATILDGCRSSINKPTDHSTAEKLGVAMVSLLIVSVFLNIISLVVACIAEHPWHIIPTSIMVVDVLFLFISLILCIAIMNYEGGGYLEGIHGREFSDRQMIGVAIWLLVAMVIARVLSNPVLIMMAIFILLPIGLAVWYTVIQRRGLLFILRIVLHNDQWQSGDA